MALRASGLSGSVSLPRSATFSVVPEPFSEGVRIPGRKRLVRLQEESNSETVGESVDAVVSAPKTSRLDQSESPVGEVSLILSLNGLVELSEASRLGEVQYLRTERAVLSQTLLTCWLTKEMRRSVRE